VSPLELTPAEALDVLRTGEVEVQGRVSWSSNATFLVTVAGDGVELPAVYKPRRGERPLWDFPSGTLCQREVAAFELSEALGWSVVPPTVLRDGPLGEGMVQRFVGHDPEEHYFTLLEQHAECFRRFAVFDILANNADRKGGHCLRDLADGHIWGIDHGLTFSTDWKLRTVIWDFGGERLAPDTADTVCRVAARLEGGLGERLAPLLSRDERDAVAGRANELVREGLLPEPGTGYHSVPWPLV
jgi:hypothetical protein